MLGAVALGQKPLPARDWPTTTPAVRSFLIWEEGVALIKGEVAEASRARPAYAYVSRQRLIDIQWRLLGQEKGREPEPAAKADILGVGKYPREEAPDSLAPPRAGTTNFT